jgi:(heptosyl)LPS beta-1,4-glucosyltransferase
MATLSLVVITRNEERDLPGCLDSVPFADEIVIVDDGSTDGTLELARRRTDRVFERKLDRFGRQKQFAIERARCDWVLVLDADERLTPELADSIRAVLDADGPADGYKMRRLTWLYDRPVTFTGWYRCSHLRLFRRGRARYVDRRVHEFPELEGQGRVECLDGDLEHHTYENVDEYQAKLDRYTRLAAEDWYDAGRRVTWLTAPWFLGIVPAAAFIREFVVRGGWRGGATGCRIAAMAARSDLRTAGHLRRLTAERS